MLYPKPCNQTSSVIPESFYRESRVGEANFFLRTPCLCRNYIALSALICSIRVLCVLFLPQNLIFTSFSPLLRFFRHYCVFSSHYWTFPAVTIKFLSLLRFFGLHYKILCVPPLHFLISKVFPLVTTKILLLLENFRHYQSSFCLSGKQFLVLVNQNSFALNALIVSAQIA